MLSSGQVFFAVHGTRAPRRSPRRRSALHSTAPARNSRYRAWIRSLPCAACGSGDAVQAAHTKNAGMRIKGSDYSCVPLCHCCHREYDNGLRSKELFEVDHNLNLADLVRRLNHDWFAYANEVK